jgi:prevent-host-death family protein
MRILLLKEQAMQKVLSIVEARNRLTQLPEELEQEKGNAVTITRRGKPVLAVMPYDLYDSIIETLEVMSDPELLTLLRQSIQEANEGKLLEWETVKQEMVL